jgi:hypothetical protein
LFPAALLAQPGRGGRDGPRLYDTATEATVTGTVESVEQMAGRGGGRGRGMGGGIHLMLKTATESLRVHLGPKVFLDERQVVVAPGDTLEITGSRVTVGGTKALIAKSIKKGEMVWTLRDGSGLPLWRGRGGRGQR